MRHGRGLASAVALAACTLAWSPPAAACVGGADLFYSAASSLLIVFLMSIVSLLSIRAATRAMGRMRRVQDGRGLRVGHVAAMVGVGIATASTIVSGGLLLALVLLVH
jgi:hypothetical protein